MICCESDFASQAYPKSARRRAGAAPGHAIRENRPAGHPEQLLFPRARLTFLDKSAGILAGVREASCELVAGRFSESSVKALRNSPRFCILRERARFAILWTCVD